MSSPLCPELYQRLVVRFGTVLIAKEGEAFVEHERTDPGTGRRYTPMFSGEEYRVNCPKCDDTKFRLYIGHRFAEHNRFAHCFNEDCYESPLARRQLYQYLFHTRRPVSLAVRAGTVPSPRSAPPEMPGTIASLATLPKDHPAVDYLRERGFMPDVLSRQYGVGYCVSADSRFKLAQGRIVVPVSMHGKLAGWQARFVGERNWKVCPVPKYYTMPGMQVQQTLYNLDGAAAQPFGVLVEGVTDVWAVGPNAMALFGKSISFAQSQHIAFAFRDRPLVVMLDGDAHRENDAMSRELAERIRASVVRVMLPDGRDPANFSSELLANMIHHACEQQRVTLPGRS